VIRVLLVIKQGFREMALMLHPNALIRIKLGGRAVPEKVLSSVWGFLSVHVLIFNVCLLLLLATNVDFITAFSTTIACMNNIGPALGDAASHYGSLPDISKWILSLAMLFGRLEFFTLLMLLTPEFWRR
jgi:trk system potassium uptake protein TrkH